MAQANLAEVLSSAACPESLFADAYAPFVGERAKRLRSIAEALCK